MSTTYTSNDNGNKGLVITSKRNEYEFSTSASYNRQSRLVSIIGLVIVIALIIFAAKWFAGAGLLAAIIPGNPFDEAQKEDDQWRILLAVLGVILLVVGLPWALIAA